MKLHLIILLLLITANIYANEYYVDNVFGNDHNPGSKEKPFKTIEQSLKIMSGGDTLHMTHNQGKPYRESFIVKGEKFTNNRNNPTIIDGHGAIVTQLRHYRKVDWKDEGDGIFSRKINNNAWVMDKQGHWSGFPIVFFDGKAAKYVKLREDLTEYRYFLYKKLAEKGKGKDELHNTLYIKLPSSKSPDEIMVEVPCGLDGIHIAKDNVAIYNLTSMYSGGDGFSTTHCKNVIFDNVRGCYNMDQGISNHGAEAVVRNSRFDHNAGCGIVDVWKESKVKYINCIIEDNVYRGAVELYNGEYLMENCIVRNNDEAILTISRKGTAVNIKNCQFVGDGNTNGISISAGCKLEMSLCNISNMKTGLSAWSSNDSNVVLKIMNNTFKNCQTIYSLYCAPENLNFDNNRYCDEVVVFNRKKMSISEFIKISGQDKSSIIKQTSRK